MIQLLHHDHKLNRVSWIMAIVGDECTLQRLGWTILFIYRYRWCGNLLKLRRQCSMPNFQFQVHLAGKWNLKWSSNHRVKWSSNGNSEQTLLLYKCVFILQLTISRDLMVCLDSPHHFSSRTIARSPQGTNLHSFVSVRPRSLRSPSPNRPCFFVSIQTCSQYSTFNFSNRIQMIVTKI